MPPTPVETDKRAHADWAHANWAVAEAGHWSIPSEWQGLSTGNTQTILRYHGCPVHQQVLSLHTWKGFSVGMESRYVWLVTMVPSTAVENSRSSQNSMEFNTLPPALCIHRLIERQRKVFKLFRDWGKRPLTVPHCTTLPHTAQQKNKQKKGWMRKIWNLNSNRRCTMKQQPGDWSLFGKVMLWELRTLIPGTERQLSLRRWLPGQLLLRLRMDKSLGETERVCWRLRRTLRKVLQRLNLQSESVQLQSHILSLLHLPTQFGEGLLDQRWDW